MFLRNRKCSVVTVSTIWQQNEQRLEELLADRALFGLNEVERKELQELLSLVPGFDTDSMDLTAASVQLACGGLDFHPMPDGLQSSIREHAGQYCARGAAGSGGDHG